MDPPTPHPTTSTVQITFTNEQYRPIVGTAAAKVESIDSDIYSAFVCRFLQGH